MPIIPPNNTTGLYGIDTTVSVGNTLFATNLNVSGNAAIGGNLSVAGGISATGNITTSGFFVGNFAGNISGNIVAPGSNTQVVFNNNGVLGAASGFTFTNTTGKLDVPGAITATGNVQGNYFLGNGSQLTGLPATYSNANVTSLLAGFGSNSISTTGNVTAGYFVGDGSLLTNINAGNITGAYGNANVSNFLANFGSNTIVTTGNITGGNVAAGSFNTGQTSLTTNGVVAWAGNSAYLVGYNAGNTAGNALVVADGANGIVELGTNSFPGPGSWQFNNATGNLTLPGNASAVNYANGTSILSGLVINPGGSNTQIQFNDNGVFAGNSGVTFNKTNGNVNVPVLISAGNVTSTQQTVIGTANVGTTGNIVISGKNIATDMAWIPDGGTAATAVNGRINIGTGWNGNISWNSTQNRLAVVDSVTRTNTATAVRSLSSDQFVNLTGNVTNSTWRQQAMGAYLRIGGGSAANTTAFSQGAGSVFSVAPGQFNIDIGNISPYNLGNTSISHAAINGGAMAIQGGSTLLNAFGIFNNFGPPIGGTAGAVGNIMGFGSNFGGLSVPTGNVFAFYHGSNATAGTTSAGTGANVRQATNYYAFMNADDLAQIQLGSLRRYHEFEAQTATSGSFAIDKNTAQVHNIVPTGNCTITGYSNMVTSVSDGATSDSQVDTLTIIIEQGSTPYTITMPTGAAFKYAGNISTVANTANAVTMISVTAANVRGTVTYLTTISPEFV